MVDTQSSQPAAPFVWGEPGIVVCTGAGISVASGLPTFRGAGGIYEESPDLAALTDASHLNASHLNVDGASGHGRSVREWADELWSHWGPMRSLIRAAVPNDAHRALAEFARRRHDLTVVTMNVDGLHQRAGHHDTIELHGNLNRTRCSSGCGHEDWDDSVAHVTAPSCPGCAAPARPAVTLFGEAPDPEPQWRAKRSVRAVTTFIAIGTSGTVSTGSQLAANARYAGSRMIWMNTDPPTDPGSWDQIVIGPAHMTVPELLLSLH